MSMFAIGTALYGVSTVAGLIGNKSKKKQAMKTNETNRRIMKLNNSIQANVDVKNQLKDFQDFADEQRKLSSSQNVELYSGGMSTKSSVFAGVRHEQRKDYYEGVQNLKENIQQIENNKNAMDIEAELSYNVANQEAKNKYNSFNTILNNAMGYYNFYNTTSDTDKFKMKLEEKIGEIGKSSSVFGVVSKFKGGNS